MINKVIVKGLMVAMVLVSILTSVVYAAPNVGQTEKININTLNELEKDYKVISEATERYMNQEGDLIGIDEKFTGKYLKVSYEEFLDEELINEEVLKEEIIKAREQNIRNYNLLNIVFAIIMSGLLLSLFALFKY